jgi:hypothetical protein
VTVGDGCVVGAGSVVTKSMPAYHVVIGNPARAYRKVAPDVPDAPGLIYEVKGDRVFVVENVSSVDQHLGTPDQENQDSGHPSFGWAGLGKAKTPVLPGEFRSTAIHMCTLVAAAALGYWLKSMM